MKKLALLVVVVLIAAAIFGVIRTFAQDLSTIGSSGPTSTQLNVANSDGGFCSDAEEARYGTDPNSPYDDLFQAPPFNGSISVGDILAVVMHYGTTPTNPNYSPAFDRGPGYTAPNGRVDVSDILMVVKQYGRYCTDIPWCSGGVHELADEPTAIPDGTDAGQEVCYAVRDAAGQIVNYYLVDYDSKKTVTGSTAGMPGDIAGEPGLPTPGAGGSTAGGSPWVEYDDCEKSKTWKDFFHFPLYKIKIHVDYQVLKDAGVYSGLVKVANDYGSDQEWWPWNRDGDPAQWRFYYYTGTGPWDAKIIVQRDVAIKATVANNVLNRRNMHATMTVRTTGPGTATCEWHPWTD